MDQSKEDKRAFFASLHALRQRWKEGTFGEILDDWRWIFTYSRRYKIAILFYTLLGVFSTSFGIVSSIAGKYVIDIITGYQTSKLALMIAIMLGSALFNLVFSVIACSERAVSGDTFVIVLSINMLAVTIAFCDDSRKRR